jgi:citrate synthase
MNLTAQLPRVAALIYRHKFYNGKIIPSDDTLDWAANYSHMMGYDSEVM